MTDSEADPDTPHAPTSRRTAVLVWLVLVLLTLVGVWVGVAPTLPDGAGVNLTATVILAIAFMKVLAIGWWFMELRGAPPVLRLAFTAWVAVFAGATIVLSAL
jgi:caa(3)-type oxidase subunit IV